MSVILLCLELRTFKRRNLSYNILCITNMFVLYLLLRKRLICIYAYLIQYVRFEKSNVLTYFKCTYNISFIFLKGCGSCLAK